LWAGKKLELGSNLLVSAAMVVPGSARMRSSLSHGIGLAIGRDAQNCCVVMRVLPGGAAAFSGMVHTGDIIVDIDSEPTASMSEQQVPHWFVGEAGTVVTLGLMSTGGGVKAWCDLCASP